MYISSITLIGFTGVWSGSGRTEITVNFPDPATSLSRIILLMGANGSGKSTLMSHLHPFADSFDGRESAMIHDDEGEKIIEMKHQGSTWVAHHHYIKKDTKAGPRTTTKSFLSKDDVELNDNGGVTTFKNLFVEEFGLEESFFKVGRLATTTANFVTLTTGARKDFIIRHLPDVSPYLDAFKQASDKCNTSNKTLKYLGDELSKLGDKELITVKVNELERIVTKEDKIVVGLGKQEAVLNDRIKDFSKKDSIQETLRLNTENEGYEDTLGKSRYALTKIKKRYVDYADCSVEELAEHSETMIGKVGELKITSENADKEFEESTITMSEVQKKITTKNRQLVDIKRSDESIEELEKLKKRVMIQIADEQKEQDSYVRILNKNGVEDLSIIGIHALTSNERNATQNTAREVAELVSKMFALNIRAEFLEYLGSELESPFISESESEATKNFVDSRREITRLEELVDKYTRLAGTAELLDKRPKACKIDTCDFVVEGKSGKSAEKKLKKIKSEIEDHKAIIKEAEDDLNFVKDIKDSSHFITMAFIKFKTSERSAIPILVNWKKLSELNSVPEFFNLIVEMGELKFNSRLSANVIFDYLDTEEVIATKEETLESIDIKIKARKESDTFIKTIEDEVETLNTDLDKKRKIVEAKRKVTLEIEGTYTDAKAVSEGIKGLITYAEGVDKMKVLINDNIDQIKKYKKDVDQYNVILVELEELEDTIRSAKSVLLLNKKERDKYLLKATRFDEYNEKIATFTEKYTKQQAVRDASDPKKGIPLVFMRTFLDDIEGIANNLFDIAFRGKFRIQFIISEKDFFIQVLKEDGEILPDVKYASDGEQALIKTIISVSLLSLYTDAWPMLACDETDSVLDTVHRSHFAGIIEGQIKELELEQVFVISHNENFRDESISVILFPGHTLLESESNPIIADFGG